MNKYPWCFLFLAGCLLSPGLALAAPPITAPPITAAAFAPDGQSVVVGSQAGIEVRSWPDLERVRSIESQLDNVHDLVFSPAGEKLAAAGGAPGESGGVEFFGWPDGQRLKQQAIHDDLIYAFAWRGDGEAWATASGDRTVRIHRATGGELEFVLQGHSRAVLALAWLPDGKTLVTAGGDQTLRVWDGASGRQLRSLDNHTSAVVALAVQPGASDRTPLVATAGADRTVRFWQPLIGRLVRFGRLKSNPLALAWTPDGGLLAVACNDGHVRTFDPGTANQVQDLPALDGWAYTLAAAPEGKELLVAGEGGQMRRAELAGNK